MRIIRYIDDHGQACYAQQRPDGTAAALTGDPFAGLTATGRTTVVHKLLAPVTPPNIICVGLNYRAHAKESNSPLPEHPVLFMKPTTALNNPGDPILIPKCATHGPEVDYECELAVVIARTARDVPEDRALQYVLGYTAANDVSARRWQRSNGGQWVRGKGFDTFCPLGPVLVTTDEIPDPQNLSLSTTLNGKVMQSENTRDMIFTVAQIVSFISRDTTLLPGTVILTGTPQGVGFARKPPVFMVAGDEVVVEIEKIGKLTNPVQ